MHDAVPRCALYWLARSRSTQSASCTQAGRGARWSGCCSRHRQLPQCSMQQLGPPTDQVAAALQPGVIVCFQLEHHAAAGAPEWLDGAACQHNESMVWLNCTCSVALLDSRLAALVLHAARWPLSILHMLQHHGDCEREVGDMGTASGLIEQHHAGAECTVEHCTPNMHGSLGACNDGALVKLQQRHAPDRPALTHGKARPPYNVLGQL